jgi:DNA polymerase
MDFSYIDFETRSEVDLLKSNASVYARHPSTIILCAVIKRNGKKMGFTNFAKQRESILKFIKGSILVAHNAQFEELLWEFYLHRRLDYPQMPPSAWKCTMAKVLAHGLPRSLEKAGDALNLIIVKDMAGKKHMLQMCKPNGSNKPEDIKRLVEYCAQDVDVTEEIDKLIPDLSLAEQKVWELDQEINFRGVKIDLPLVNHIQSILEVEKEDLLVQFREATNGVVDSPTLRQQFKDWLAGNGLVLPDLTAKTVDGIVFSNLSNSVKSAVRIRQTLSKTSNAKYDRITNEIDTDGRMRCNLIYHAASTGRWGGTGAQLQNLPRPRINVDLALTYLDRADFMWPEVFGSCADAAKSLVRSVIIPEKGKVLIGADFSGIEARVTPWLAGQEETLDIFRRFDAGLGPDIYCYEAEKMFGYPVNKDDQPDERQVGKAEVLSMGYQGGIAALYKICQLANISIEPVADRIWASASANERHNAETAYATYERSALKSGSDYYSKREGLVADIIKQRWRAANPKIVSFWAEVNAKAIEAVQSYTECTTTIQYGSRTPPALMAYTDSQDKSHGPDNSVIWYREGDFLYCQLPSGRRLAYYKPRVEMVRNKFGTDKMTLTYLTLDAKTKQLVRRPSYGGLLTENLVQAISRDIMVAAMFNVKNDNLDIVLTVHDELLLECETTVEIDRVTQLMTRPLSWAKNLPLAVNAWRGKRYGK